MIRAPLIDGDFDKSVRVLIPEGGAHRQVAPRALQDPTCRNESGIKWHCRCPQAGHGVAEVVDIADLAEIVRPVWAAIRVILARPTGGGSVRASIAATGANSERYGGVR